MTVYAKKGPDGQPTGLYIIEVTVGGKRYRETTRDHAAALARNAELTAGPTLSRSLPAPIPAEQVYTVRQLKREALVCWKGHKDKDQSIQRFEAVCDLLGLDTPLARVRTSALDAVVVALAGRSLAPKTIHRYLAAMSAAMRWACTRDKLVAMPIFPWPEVGKGNDTVLRPEDEPKMLVQLRKSGSPDVLLIMEVLLATGARIGEVCGLEPEDIDLRNEEVTFRDTKNGDDRTVPLEAGLGGRLRALALVGMPSYRRINLAFHRAARLAGVTYKVTPHVLRHTVGTRLDTAGFSVKAIGKMLGHKSERTTMGYVHPEKETLRQAAAILRPVAMGTPRGVTEGQSDPTGTPQRPNRFDMGSAHNRSKLPENRGKLMEASPGIEPGYEDLQSYDAV